MSNDLAQEKEERERALPFYGLSMDKQVRILKAFVAFYEKSDTGTSYKEIASVVNASPANVSGSLKFWKSIGILEADRGQYKPSQTLIESVRNIEWGDEETGWARFREAIQKSWFVSHLAVAFRIKTSMSYDDLLNSLGAVSGLAKKDQQSTNSLKNLIELLETSKVVVKDNSSNYTLNEELKESRRRTVTVSEDKQMMQFRIGAELYAVGVAELKDFIKSSGKKLDTTSHAIE